jgi:hypothetical protein
MNIKAFKLITGEEVLAEVLSDTDAYVLKNPVGIAVVRGRDGAPNVGFAPFPLHAEQVSGSELSIDKSHVVYYYTPSEDFVSNYDQIFGTGLVLPPKTLITG